MAIENVLYASAICAHCAQAISGALKYPEFVRILLVDQDKELFPGNVLKPFGAYAAMGANGVSQTPTLVTVDAAGIQTPVAQGPKQIVNYLIGKYGAR